MNSAPAVDPPPPLDIRGARVSTVVVQRVPKEGVPRFLECQRGIDEAAKSFPGYLGTELYPPADGQNPEWVAVINFDDQESLQRWLDSSERAEWTKKLKDDVGDFKLKTLPSGFGGWFAGLVNAQDGEPPPSWKIAISVLLGLYPTVMVLALLVSPHLSPLGLSVAMLISNVLSVSLCQWIVLPPVNRALGPWLRANAPERRAQSIGGLILIVLLLGGIAALFRLATG
jgi:uncharacterized protein